MKSQPASLRTRFTIPSLPAAAAPVIFNGPVVPAGSRSTKFFIPAVLLFAGVATLTTALSARAADTVDAVKANPTTTTAGYGDLSSGANYTTTITPTAATTTDVNFAAGTTYSVTTFDANGAALSFGSLDDLDTTQALTLTNSSATAATLALNLGSTNATAGSNAADLLFVGVGANLSITPGSAGGLTLLLNNTGNIDNAGTLSLGTAITITAGDTVSFTGAGATTVGGAIGETAPSGAVTINDAGGSVTFSGANTYSGLTTVSAGTLTLNGTNTSAGSTTLSGGTLRLGNATANDGGLASGLLTLGGGTLQATSAAPLSLSNAVSLTGNSTISGAQSLTFTGAFGGTAGSLAITNSSTTTLTGAATYTGQTTVGNGTLSFAPATASVNDSLGALAFNLGGGTVNSTYQGTGTTTLTFSNLLARTGGATGNFTVTGGTNGSTNSIVLTQVGGATPTAGTLLDRGIFFGGSAYATVDAGGFLRAYTTTDTNAVTAAAGASNIASVSTNNVFVTGSQTAQASAAVNTINLGGTGTTASSLTLATSATLGTNGILANGAATISGGTAVDATTAGAELLIRENAGNLTISTPITNNGSTASALTTSGPGTVTLGSANTYTGATTIGTGSTLVATNAGSLGTSSNTAGVVVDGTLSFGTANTNYTFGGSVTGSGTINATVSGAGNTTVLGSISSLSGFTGTINVVEGGSGGKFQLSQSPTAVSAINVASGATLYLNAATTTAAAISLGGGATGETYGQLRTGTNDTFNGPITLTGTVTGTNNSTITAFGNTDTINGAIGQSGGTQSLLLGGSTGGSVVLTNANTYTGATIVGVGTVGNATVNLTLSGAGSDASSSYSISAGNTFQLTPGATNTGNMFTSASAPTITLNGPGAVLALTGNTTNSVTETFGSLAFNGGYDTVTITGATGKTTTLVAGASSNSFTRTGLATGLILGTNLGQGGTGNAALTLGDGGASLTLVGTNTLSGAASSDTTQAVKIVPYLFGGTPGSAGSNFVTYDTTNGFRTLTGSEDTALVAGSTTAANPVNAQVNASATLTAANLTLNSLLFTNSGMTLSGTSTALTVNSGAVALNVTTGTVGSTITGLTLGNGEGVLTAPTGDTLTINAPISVTSSGGLTKAGGGTLTLGAVNAYTGATTVDQGTLTIAAAGSVAASSGTTVLNGASLTNSGMVGALTTNSGGTATLNGGSTTGAITENGTLTIAGTTAVTTGNISGTGGTGAISYTNTFNGGTGNTLNFTGTNSFTSIANTSAGNKLILTGAGSSNTFANSFSNSVANATSTTIFQSGTYTFVAGTNNQTSTNQFGNFQVGGGTVVLQGGLRGGESAGGTVTVSSGVLQNQGQFDTESQTSNTTIAYNVTGGLFDQYGQGQNFALGNGGAPTTLNTASINVSGGIYQSGITNNSVQTLNIGTGVARTNAIFSLSGTGIVRFNGTLAANAAPGTGGVNQLNLTGGTLTATAINLTNLGSNDGTNSAATGTLYNGGTTLAPGYFGQALGAAVGSTNAQFTGKTTITGVYQSDSANAALAINIGGTTAANGFGVTAADYDNLAVTGTANFGSTATTEGKLNVGLINSYTPPSNNVTQLYNVVTVSTALSGTFSNLVTGNSTTTAGGASRVVLANGLSSMLVGINTGTAAATTDGLTSVPARTVSLGGYQATNTYNAATGTAWDAANAADWTNFDPGSTATPASQASGAIAQFADGANTGTGAVSVTLNSTRNIQGIQFSSATTNHNYTINSGSSGTIILDNRANNAAATITDSSSAGNANVINVPITLNSNLTASVTNATTTTTIGSAISESATGSKLTKTGLGTLILGSANSYTGGTVINSGILAVGAANALGTTGTISFGGGTLQYANAGSVTDYSSRFNTAANQAYSIDTNGQTVTYASSLTSSGGTLTVSDSVGTGSLTLTAANTYTGGTTVGTATARSGTLLVNNTTGSGAGSGVVMVNNGGTLGGAGMLTVAGATVNGTLAPGATVGTTTGALTLTTTNGVTINGNLTIGVQSGGVGTSVTTTGGLTLGGGSTLTINGTPDGAANYDIANYGGTLTGTFANFTPPSGYTINYDGTNFGASDIELDVAPIPEPSTWVFGVLTTAAVGFQLRRRKGRNA